VFPEQLPVQIPDLGLKRRRADAQRRSLQDAAELLVTLCQSRFHKPPVGARLYLLRRQRAFLPRPRHWFNAFLPLCLPAPMRQPATP
jgi:hypothetical protein